MLYFFIGFIVLISLLWFLFKTLKIYLVWKVYPHIISHLEWTATRILSIYLTSEIAPYKLAGAVPELNKLTDLRIKYIESVFQSLPPNYLHLITILLTKEGLVQEIHRYSGSKE